GPDFRQQMLSNNVQHLSALVFTHDHKDHIAGMDDIRAFNFVNRSAVDVFASLPVQESLKREFPYVFEDLKYPGVPEINIHTIHEEPFSIGSLRFMPLPVLHYRLPVNGYRIGDFSYITDANHIPEDTMTKLRGSRVLVINALRHEKHISHFNLEEALAIIGQVNPEQAFLTHISHQLGRQCDIDPILPQNVKCAYDGLEFHL
ncbi:MAG: MBL fold metallo-hydrolase, partial [Bacteroidota bacterium]